MLSFVKRRKDPCHAETRAHAILAFRSYLEALTPVAFVRPTPRRVTAQTPYEGLFLEDDLTLATHPDGTPLATYMIDGYAIDNLWLGFDKAACQRYLATLPHDAHLVPAYPFTNTMAALAAPILGETLRTDVYEYLVEYKDHFLPVTKLEFYRAAQKLPAPRGKATALQRAA